MPTLTKAQVLHIAKLARLKISESELDIMSKELTSIFGYIDMLSEVNTNGVEPTAQVTGLTSRLREDEIKPSDAKPDELLACSPLPIIDGQISTPHAHG